MFICSHWSFLWKSTEFWDQLGSRTPADKLCICTTSQWGNEFREISNCLKLLSQQTTPPERLPWEQAELRTEHSPINHLVTPSPAQHTSPHPVLSSPAYSSVKRKVLCCLTFVMLANLMDGTPLAVVHFSHYNHLSPTPLTTGNIFFLK